MFELIPYRRNNTYSNIFREMEELERRFFGDGSGRSGKAEGFSGFRTDVSDQGESYLLEADLPGFDKDSIRRVSTLVELHDYPIDPPVEAQGEGTGNREQGTGDQAPGQREGPGQ